MKRYSTLLVITEMQIQTIGDIAIHLLKQLFSKSDMKFCLGYKETGSFMYCWWECKIL